MTIRRTLLSAAVPALWLVPLCTLAQEFTLEAAPAEEKKPVVVYTSEVEAGVGYNTENSFKFGEYTGLTDKGPFPIANIGIHGRTANDSDKPYFWDLIGTNLGLESRYVRGNFGLQGDYSGFIEYNQIPHYQFKGETPYRGAGTRNLTLPPGWVPAGSTGAMTQLLPSLQRINIKTERKQIGAGISKYLGKRWKVSTQFHHEDKTGLDTIGGTFAAAGGGPNGPLGAILPENINYDTNRLNSMVQYTGEKGQAKLAYEYSSFNNGASTLKFQNAFTGPPSCAPGCAYPNGVGEFQLPPDNQAHTVTFSGGYNVMPTTRVMLNASWSRFLQDQKFVPFSPSFTPIQPLPRNSLDGKVNNYLANLRVVSRPRPKLDLGASYRFWKRDDTTPQAAYDWVLADSAQETPLINLPYSVTQHKVDLDAGYRVLPSTKVSAGYTYDYKYRDYQEVYTTADNTFRGKVRTTPMAELSGWVEYAYSFRTNSKYRFDKPFLDSDPNAVASDIATDQQNPNLRKFYLADRDRNQVRGVLSYTPTPKVGLTLDTSFMNDNYAKSELGLQDAQTLATTLDASYTPNKDISGRAFFTYEQLNYQQFGCSFSPAGSTRCVDPATAPSWSWAYNTDNTVYTAGLETTWHVNEQLDVGADYLFTRAITSIDVHAGSNLNTDNFPNLKSTRHRVGFHADYKLREQFTARFAYLFEHLDTADWAVNGVHPDTISNVITMGDDSPDYNANVFGISLIYKF